MMVLQKYVDLDEAVANPAVVDQGFLFSDTLINDSDMRPPIVTDFGPESGASLALFAKDLDTIIRGLNAYDGKKSVELKGPVAAIPVLFGDPSKQQNVTVRYIKGKLDSLGNNMKSVPVKAAFKLERLKNVIAGSPDAKLTGARKYADKIGFNGVLYKYGSASHSGTKDIVRMSNLAKGHVLVYLIPADKRTFFDHAHVCAIEGKGATSLAALGKLLRTVKIK